MAGAAKTRSATREAFAREALAHLDHLYRVACHLAKDSHKAEDLAQETFARALAASDRLYPRSSMKAWLTKILYNLFIDDYRQNKRWVSLEPGTPDSNAEPDELPAENPGPEARALASELNAEINDALMRISEEFRTPIILVDMGDFSYQEAAEILSCPVGTIRSRLSRGRKLLHQALEKYVGAGADISKKHDL